MLKISLPRGAEQIIGSLCSNGHEAYIVGGCVRDSLLGLTPKDWDICTSATPAEVEACLSKYKIIETGIRHGTVTVLSEDGQYEVTTFREEGAYSDNRHPDTVKFVKNIRSDLSRRDFTVNAMAYNPLSGLIDPFGGSSDLSKGLISCVGDPFARFGEDALRIMRAMRFAAVYGFSISEKTSNEVHNCRRLLHNIAAERINIELQKLLSGKGAFGVLLDYRDVIATVTPELDTPGYEQAMLAVSRYQGIDMSVRIALLFSATSPKDAAKSLSSLKFDGRTQREVLSLLSFLDADIEPTPPSVRRWLNRLGTEQFQRLIDAKLALGEDYKLCERLRTLAETTVASGECYRLEDLAVGGTDIIREGVLPGKRVGELLNQALSLVIDGDLQNSRDMLLAFIRSKL